MIGGMRKAIKMEFPLIPLEVEIRESQEGCKLGRSAEWKPLTTSHSPSVEQLCERFGGMEM